MSWDTVRLVRIMRHNFSQRDIIRHLIGLFIAICYVIGSVVAVREDVLRQSIRDLRRSDWFKEWVAEHGLRDWERLVFGSVNDLEIVLYILGGFFFLLLLEKLFSVFASRISG